MKDLLWRFTNATIGQNSKFKTHVTPLTLSMPCLHVFFRLLFSFLFLSFFFSLISTPPSFFFSLFFFFFSFNFHSSFITHLDLFFSLPLHFDFISPILFVVVLMLVGFGFEDGIATS